ncbi:MAG: glycosyltransferase family 4 protein [bacterium]|nr:glycosyltransferase family 4 protein [bacterium]
MVRGGWRTGGGGQVRVACVNQDRGIRPGSKKGAAVHVAAMESAFAAAGAQVVAVSDADPKVIDSSLQQLHRREPIDLIYERYALGAFAAGRTARALGIPHVLEVNAPLEEEARRYRANNPIVLDARAERELLRSAARVVVVSSAVADYVRARGAPAQRILLAPNGVDPSRFDRPVDSAVTRVVPRSAVTIGFHGRLRPWHNFGLLVDAFEELVLEGLDVFLLTVGGGPFDAALEPVAGFGRSHHFEWVEHERIGGYVARYDLLALTHDAHAPFYFSPLKLAEAMVSRAVPVVPMLGDLPALVENGREGLVYRPGDRGALVASLRKLVVDRELRERCATAARERALRNTWNGIADRILDGLSEAVG